ncbi:nonribosomal peptide synthetase [Sporocytophaga myxococcoides]|uniref:Nonribosomal peptide synthetase n=1 Tax=Sporocytophaga myxococcoides TaxID=153721 RepID=A0A098LHQ1_9BACT|nr:non-ribosomal peptide synthetase [Sporocytophaga myxococcoides]GAL86511.1 nonribosomal peptide synthetase [Sporocytophaga myxococcoides]
MESEVKVLRQNVRLQKNSLDKLQEKLSLLNEDKFSSFILSLSAFIALAKRYTDQDKFLVAHNHSKQNKPSQRISFIEIDLSEDPTFEILIQQLNDKIQKDTDGTFADKKDFYPFVINFSFDDKSEQGISNLNLNIVSSDNQNILPALSINLSNTEEVISGCLEARLDLMEITISENTNNHFCNLLQEAVLNPKKRISECNMLDESERNKILFEWNATEKNYPKNICLHHLIEKQVDNTPDSIAVIYNGQSLTYKELNRRANCVVERLIARGIKEEDLVGVLFELSLESVIVILGVLKAGAAYVPLDTNYPVKRLQLLVDDAKPKLLITNSSLKGLLEFAEDRTLIINDNDWLNSDYLTNPSTNVKPENAAYVMYTSGSTGSPKGIVIQHNSVVNNIMLIKDRYELTPDDIVPSMPSLAFDASVSKLFPILTIGGTVVLPTEDEIKDVEKTLELINKYNMPYFSTPPSILRVINSINPDLSRLRIISCGGEALKFSDINNINKHVPILNIYGPTEATVSSCTYTIPKNSPPITSRVPIGKPNPNCKVYILDKHMNCMPVNCYGTLYIGGIGVARGYLNNPELTAQRFIKNPFVDGEVLYNTGDIARWLPDGNIDFLGRNDNQIKIRGFRIQMEEVEKILTKHPSVIEGKIIVKGTNDEDKFMIACIIPKEGESVTIESMRNFIEKYLPDYMVPSDIMVLDQFPLNQNNKVDSKALLQKFNEKTPVKQKISLSVSKNNVEKDLINFWKEILNKEINIQENFFHAGGHSLHAMQLKMFINKKFNTDFSMKDIFNNLTIEKLTSLIASKIQLTEDNIHIPNSLKNNNPFIEEKQSSENITPVDLKDISNIKSQSLDTSLSKKEIDLIASNNKESSFYQLFFKKPTLLDLSFNERRLYFLYKFLPNKATYNVVKAYSLSGKVNISVLEKSIKQLLDKHLNLRKNFIEIDGEPKAKLNLKSTFKVRVCCLSDFLRSTTDDEELILEKLVEDETEKPFDLSKDLPIRLTLIKKRKESSVLILSAHHIISDAWSFAIILEELNKLYNSNLNGEEIELEDLTREYNNYVGAQKQYLNKIKISELLGYWKNKLSDKISKLKLPYERNGKDIVSDNALYEEILIPTTLINSLQKYSREKDVTLFMTFFSAFQTLLFKYSQNEFINTAIPIVDRANADTKKLVGFFVNTLIIPTDFSNDVLFDELVEEVRQTILESFQNQDLPYEILANELRKDTGADVNSLIQVMFAFQNVHEDPLHLTGIKAENILLKNKHAKFDLTVSVSEQADGYLVSAEYKSDLFHSITIKRMLNSFYMLIEQVMSNPKIKISQIEVLNQSVKELLTKVWNDTKRNLPDFSVHELFERQVFSTPDAIALNFNGKKISYNDLNIRANHLAHYLKKQGIASEELVGILMDESELSIVSLIAVLKTGGAYLPLDPAYPKERIAYMLNDSRVKTIISEEKYLNYLPESSYQWIALDQLGEELSKEKDTNPESRILTNHLAYVMYTSGSTGNPKGVGVEHKNIVRLVKNTNYATLSNNTKLLKTGAFSFDASTFEVWGILLNGGELHIYPKENLLDHQLLKEKIKENEITLMWFTVSWFNQLVDLDVDLFKPLQSVFVGGDKLSVKHINKVKQAIPHLEIVNGYGPTENTTFSLYHKIESISEEDIPIGKPITNTTVYILDKSLNLLPIGVQGEIYVGGKGVARGYINDEKRTQEKFIPDPFSYEGRLYKTGDLGRWLENGTIEFGGRKDNQIKLRGYRIELGEIENAISCHPLIEDSVVIMKDDNGDKKIIGFYLSNTNLTEAEVKTFLRKTLPEFMIPAYLIKKESFPLTSNGKINRQALANSTKNYIKTNKTFEFAFNATEEKLVAIFEEILGRDAISITDNFFELGGHSLLATKVMAKIEREFGQNYPLSILFEAPTIKELSKVIKGDSGIKKTGIISIQPKGHKPPLFLLPGYLFYHNLSKYLGDDQPLYGFEPLNIDRTEEVAAMFIKQMKKIQPTGPYYIGGFCASGIIAYEVAQQLTAAGDEIGLLSLFEVYTPEATVSKASKKYLSDKFAHWKAAFSYNSFRAKVKLIYNESQKLLQYFLLNQFRSMISDYKLKPYNGKIVLFKALDELVVSSSSDPYMGWNRYCSAHNITLIKIPGNHNTLFKEPYIGITAAQIKKCLENENYNVEEI